MHCVHILGKSQREVEGHPDSNDELRRISMPNEFFQDTTARADEKCRLVRATRVDFFCLKVQLSA